MDGIRGPMQKLAVSLFQACRKEYPDGNLLYSPAVSSTGLLLLFLGAEGRTKTQIECGLHLLDCKLFANSTFETDLMIAYRHVWALINKSRKTEEGAGFSILRVMRFFVDPSIRVRKEFLDLCAKLGTDVATVDFHRNPTGSRHEINDFVDETLQGQMSELIPSGVIQRDTQMVFVSGIKIKARWDIPFNPKLTTKKPFYKLDGSVKNVEMMTGTLFAAFYHDHELGLQYVELPYANNIASLVLLVPMKRDGLTALGTSFSTSHFARVTLLKRLREVQITLPKFKVESKMDVKACFMRLGCSMMCNENADLGQISPDPLCLSAAFHTVTLSADEYGSNVEEWVTPSSREPMDRPAPSISVTMDRPCLFAVRHNKTGVMVCLGRLEDV